MRTIAALSTTVTVALAVAAMTGQLPTFRRARAPAPSERTTWLAQAGLAVTPAQFTLVSFGCGVVALVLVTAATGTPAVAVVPAIVAASVPRWVHARRRGARLRALQEAWPDGIRDLVAATTAGMSLHQALLGLVDRGPAVLREAFARYPALARVVGTATALEVVKEELADPSSDRVIEVLILADEQGGHLLGDILRDLADAATKDVRTLEGIQTASLEQRINARAVFALPWLLLVALTLQDSTFRLFYRSSAGLVTVGVGAVLSLVGVAIVSRLSRDPVENRVLGAAAPAVGTSEVWS